MFASASTFGTNNPSPFGGGSFFGTQNSGSTSVFGASSSSPAGFGSTSSGFGGSSFGSPSVLGQKSGFGSFGTTSSPGFGSQPAFGVSSASNTTGMLGSTTGFGGSNFPMLGSTSSNATGMSGSTNIGVSGSTTWNQTTGFGVSSNPMLGSISGTGCPRLFGSTTSNLGGSSFGTLNNPSTNLGFSSSPVLGSTTPNTGGSSFGTLNTPCTGFSLGSNTSGGGFTGFGANQGGSRVVRYVAVNDGGEVKSISAMAAYKARSQEELRWEDYQRGDKGGAQTTGLGFHNPSSSTRPFSPTTPFAPPQNTSSGFASLSTTVVNPFTTSPAWSSFNTHTHSWLSNTPSPTTNMQTNSWLSTTPSPSTMQPPLTNSWLSPMTNMQPPQTNSWLSTTPLPTNMQPPRTNSWLSTTPSPTTVQPPQTNSWLSTTSSPTNIQPPQTQTQNVGFQNIGQVVGGGGQNQNALAQPSTLPSNVVPINPFGTEMPRNHEGHAPPVQYNRGIRNLPVIDKPNAVVRITSSLTTRHISQRRMKMPERKQPGDKRVPFFGDEPVFVARENPRAWLASKRGRGPEDESS